MRLPGSQETKYGLSKASLLGGSWAVAGKILSTLTCTTAGYVCCDPLQPSKATTRKDVFLSLTLLVPLG